MRGAAYWRDLVSLCLRLSHDRFYKLTLLIVSLIWERGNNRGENDDQSFRLGCDGIRSFGVKFR